MSSHHDQDVNAVIDAIPGRSLPAAANLTSIGLIVLGVVAFASGLFGMGDGGVVAWGAFLVGVIWTLGVSQGGVLFSLIQTGTTGRWGRPVKRIAETFSFFLPVGWLLLLVFLVFGLKIYAWNPATLVEGGPVALEPHSAEAISAKPLWLSPMFFIARDLLGLGFIIVLDLIYVRASLRPDMVMAAQRLGDKAPGWWKSVTGGSTDLVGAVKSGLATQAGLVPLLAVTYALVWSMLSFDLVMSLSPWWYSNMFGAWQFVSAFWLSLAMLAFVSMFGRDWLHVGKFVRPKVTHDLGKMMLAGSMFWAYTAFSQLLPIWYTDMPEETDYLLVRMYLPEWAWLSQFVAMLCFLGPFTILLSRGIKKMRWPFAGIAALIMFGVFCERTLLVQPSIFFHDPRFNVLWAFTCIGTWLGFVGLWVQVVGRALASVPPLVVSDPHLETHPWDVHVHGLDHAH